MVSNRLRDDDVERHLRQACAELERRLRAGEPCAAEDWLVTSAVLASHFEAALELVYAEFVVREQLGQRPAPEAWYARFPQWRRDLEQLFQVHQLGRANSDQDFATTVTMVRREHDAPGSGLAGLPIAPGRFGNYELLAEIGRGGMGAVYKARDLSLDRVVALKMILAGTYAGADERTRFRRETEAVARLHHSHIVQIYEVGEHEGRPYFSLEYVDGGTLGEKLAGTPQPAGRAAVLLEQLAGAVHYARGRTG